MAFVWLLDAVHKDGQRLALGAYTKREDAEKHAGAINAENAHFLGIVRFDIRQISVHSRFPQDPPSESESNGNGHVNGDGEPSETRALSKKETLILEGVHAGESNKEIARRLVMTESTVKVHMKAVLRKLRLKNRTQAALYWASQDGDRHA